MWDLALLQPVPGLRVAAPRDAEQVRLQLREAVNTHDGPTLLRYSKGAVGPAVPAIRRDGGVDILHEPSAAQRRRDDGAGVLIVAVGALAPACLDAATQLADAGISSTVIDPRWVTPIDPAILDLARQHRLIVTVEDGVRAGGIGATLAHTLHDADIDTPCRDIGIPRQFLPHATRQEILTDLGLTAPHITQQITRWATHTLPDPQPQTTLKPSP